MSKLSKQDKINIFHQWQLGYSPNYLARKWHLATTNINYLIRLLKMHGLQILDQPHRYYSAEFIETAVELILSGTKSVTQLSVELGLKSSGMLFNWMRKYKENGYNVVIKQKGRPTHGKESKQKRASTKDQPAGTRELTAAYRKLLYKKTASLGARPKNEIIAQAITELRHEYQVSVTTILNAIAAEPSLPQIARSTYYYTLSKTDQDQKNQSLLKQIKDIFTHHQGRYGYRRVTLQLRREGWSISFKKVRRLMRRFGLVGNCRNKRKYSSYRGTIGKIAPNYIQRSFFAIRPNLKWYTDITEFHLNGQKLYLSPILDGCGGVIVSYAISRHPDMKLVMSMLDQAFTQNPALNGCTFHTDQGSQYQSPIYQRALKLHGITQSMSRKGNSMDDGLMENFFGLLKTEMFYGQESKYHDLKELEQAIIKYIDYYNNERIKYRLKGLTPIEYRDQALTN